jgi:hypothetical protein
LATRELTSPRLEAIRAERKDLVAHDVRYGLPRGGSGRARLVQLDDEERGSLVPTEEQWTGAAASRTINALGALWSSW